MISKEWEFRMEFSLADGRRVMVNYNPPNGRTIAVTYQYTAGESRPVDGHYVGHSGVWNKQAVERHIRRELEK